MENGTASLTTIRIGKISTTPFPTPKILQLYATDIVTLCLSANVTAPSHVRFDQTELLFGAKIFYH